MNRGTLERPPTSHRWGNGDGTGSGVTLASAVRDHWFLASFPIVVLVGVALWFGLTRTPTYTAETELIAGDISSAPPEALPGYTDAANTLAETYSRTIRDDDIVGPVASELGLSAESVRANLSAAPVPESPIFHVTGTADSARRAIEVSELAADALLEQATGGSDAGDSSESEGLLERYRDAELEVTRAENRVDRLETLGSANTAIREAESDLAAARVRSDALRDTYVSSSQGVAGGVEIVERPTGATSDEASALQLQVFIAAVAGIVVGLALALFRANSVARLLAAPAR
jgi:uncharacterized protein involved in exopolysaccharide biosynthesis